MSKIAEEGAQQLGQLAAGVAAVRVQPVETLLRVAPLGLCVAATAVKLGTSRATSTTPSPTLTSAGSSTSFRPTSSAPPTRSSPPSTPPCRGPPRCPDPGSSSSSNRYLLALPLSLHSISALFLLFTRLVACSA
uniref:Uncharacterized protein n=1 Tax=Arundo donax TaxID=35708 RepID=A0A0A9B7L0_ARUDO